VARDWALFLHLVGVLLFVGASVGVAALRLLAIGKDRPSESALLLRAVPVRRRSAPSPAPSPPLRAPAPSPAPQIRAALPR